MGLQLSTQSEIQFKITIWFELGISFGSGIPLQGGRIYFATLSEVPHGFMTFHAKLF